MIDRFQMVKIHQQFQTDCIRDIPAAVHHEIKQPDLAQRVQPGQTVAVAVGSRGIANLASIIRSLVHELKTIGSKPFIVPAMGSHGGGTAEGQRNLLRRFGICEEQIGAPVTSSMDVITVGTTPEGFPVYLDKHAATVDHIVPVNRIKPHTDFVASIESGLMKIAAVGLGKQIGAETYHKLFLDHGYYRVIVSLARELIRRHCIAFGLAVVENQREETALIRAVPAEKIEQEEESLLKKARQTLAGLPFDAIDLLIVDRIGKDISGTGMDQNVIARSVSLFSETPKTPKIKRIFVRNLSEKTMGNAVGIGNADFTTSRLVNGIDQASTYLNCFTGYAPELARIPPYFENDRLAVEQALRCIGPITPGSAGIVHIKDTLNLEFMNISESLLPKIGQREDIKIVDELAPMQFDPEGNLISDL